MARKVLGGRATLYPPTEKKPFWRFAVQDDAGTRRVLTGGHSEDEALRRAQEALGEYRPGQRRRGAKTPTFTEVFEEWFAENEHRWGDRTQVAYRYRYQTNLRDALGDKPISAITDADMRRLNAGPSREQAKRVRTIVKAVFEQGQRWTGRPGTHYSELIRLPGAKSADRNRAVPKSQIPSSTWVNTTIDLCYSSFQRHPASPMAAEPDPITGYHEGDDLGEPELLSHLGVSREILDSMRRGIPKHYTKVAERKTEETHELAGRMRQIGLITALGAAGGLRIGEVLALRPRHFFERETFHNSKLVAMFSGQKHLEQVDYDTETWKLFDPLHIAPWNGTVRVEEQVSPISTGQMHVSYPKNRKPRTVHLQPYLYPNTFVPDLGNYVRAKLPEQDRHLPLWKTGIHHAKSVWGDIGNSAIPLHYLLYRRMQELWDQTDGSVPHWENALLFPARNDSQSAKEVLYPENWPFQQQPTFKTYQNPTNLNTRYVHRIYDFSAQLLNEQPGKTGRSRQGWTHHNLRHYAISQWIAHGVPLPFVSKQAGHANEGFTLQRYASAISTGYEESGFEG